MKSIPEFQQWHVRKAVIDDHWPEIHETAQSEGICRAIMAFNTMLMERTGEYMWPPEWFEDDDLSDVLGALSDPVQYAFQHGVRILDFFLLLKEVPDVVEWKKAMEQERERLNADAGEGYFASSKIMGTQSFLRNPGAMADAVLEIEAEASESLRKANPMVTQLNDSYFSARGKPSHEAWAIKALAAMLGDYREPKDYALLARLLKNIGGLKIKSSYVRSIMKRGIT